MSSLRLHIKMIEFGIRANEAMNGEKDVRLRKMLQEVKGTKKMTKDEFCDE